MGQMSRWTTLICTATALAGVAAGLGAPPALAADGHPPGPGIGPAQLQAVSALSATDVWAVGTCHNKLALVKHWDGSAWSRVLAPHPGDRSSLFGLATVSATDVWVVGGYQQDGFHPLVEHFDGSTWTIVDSPAGPGADRYLYSVSAVSAADIWAVGAAYGADGRQLAPVAQRWDGTSWSAVPGLPDAFTPRSVLARTADDVWVVGSVRNDGGRSVPATFHWDGTAFTDVSTPHGHTGAGGLMAVTGLAADDVWAVGGGTSQPVTEHWDGARWRLHRMLAPGQHVDLDAVSGSSRDLWAVGNDVSSGSPRILRWDGAAWQTVSGAFESGVTNLLGVSATAADDAWVVGGHARTGGEYHTVVEHWDGQRWTESH